MTRGTLGWIETGDFDKVPPDLRFFAGGDRSIWCAATNTNLIAPKYANGDLKVEVDNRIAGVPVQTFLKRWGAVFVDSGEAVSDIRRSDFKTGTGVGVRWESPVG